MDFKKTLIATSAIVAVGGLGMAPADAASKPKLKISGYYEIFMGVADGDRPGSTTGGTPVIPAVRKAPSRSSIMARSASKRRARPTAA